MRTLILILSILFSVVGFGQVNIIDKEKKDYGEPNYHITDGHLELIDTTKTPKVDTLNIPIVTIKESMDYLTGINKKLIAMKELNLIADREFNSLVNELNRIVAILEKKKKLIK